MRHRYPIGATLVLSAALVGACRGSGAVDAAPPQQRQAVAVPVARVTAEQEPVTLEATGSFQPQESSDVAPEASGRVVATPVEVGQFVRAGQVLVRLQGVDADLRLDEARAAVTKAEAAIKLAESQNALALTTVRRYSALLATGDVSRTVFDQARTEAETSQQDVNTARASLLQARAQLAQAEKAARDVVVAAPFAGFVADRKVSLGEYVQPSTPVVTLVQIDPLRLQLTIPGVQAAQVSRGQEVTARVDAYPDRIFAGEITAVNPSITTESRSFIVEARVRNQEHLLKPGMFATASIGQGRTREVILVPRGAVVEDVNTNSFRVFVIDDRQRARLKVVQLAPRQQGDQVRIVSGLEAGQRVATGNLGPLYDTAPVTIATPGAAPAAQ
jgi:membrane fusion protein, multidrug efflux system